MAAVAGTTAAGSTPTYPALDGSLRWATAAATADPNEIYVVVLVTDGEPKFDRLTGGPLFAIQGHDVEEFTGVVRRYGATTLALREMMAAAKEKPAIADEPINIACGTCHRQAA